MEKQPSKIVDLSTLAKQSKARSKALKAKASGTTLCKRGFHKWQDNPRKQFDVKQGRLISIQRCTRCGKEKTLTG